MNLLDRQQSQQETAFHKLDRIPKGQVVMKRYINKQTHPWKYYCGKWAE